MTIKMTYFKAKYSQNLRIQKEYKDRRVYKRDDINLVLQLKTQSVKSTKKSYIRVNIRVFNRVLTTMYLSLYTKLIVHTI